MGLRAALAQLATLEAALTITDPVSASIKRVYSQPPKRGAALDMPCFVHAWTLLPVERWATGGVLSLKYAVHSQLYVAELDIDRAADIASAFAEALIVALNHNISLGSTVRRLDLRGGDPTLALLEHNGLPYVGLNLFYDLALFQQVAFA